MSSILSFNSRANVFGEALTLDMVRERAPAVFAPSAHERMTHRYTFIPTERVLSGLMQAGFVPVEARQANTRTASSVHARHIVRLRRRFETVQLRDAVPEVVFLNSHRSKSALVFLRSVVKHFSVNFVIRIDQFQLHKQLTSVTDSN